jgi:hypothetical protein
MRRILFIAFALALGLGLGRADEPVSPAALTATADDLLRQVSALRGLSIKSKVARGVLSRAEIGDRLKAKLHEEYKPSELEAEARVLHRLGLLPPSVKDYPQLILDLLMEQVAGFYDPETRKLYIADWLPLELQKPALAHELEHALQDQHYDLKSFVKPLKDDGDRQSARLALVEGDGTALMLEWEAQSLRLPADQLPDLVASMSESLLKGGGLGQTPLFDKAPAYVRETLMFPYFEGLRFVMALRRGHPWKRVDEAWKSPPESTEQILHPDRYLSHDAPVRVDAKALTSLAPRKEIRRDVLGELGLRLLFRSRLPEPQADQAAAGWGGDRLVAYADDHSSALPVVLDLSTWDTETDATEAAQAFRALFAAITGSHAPPAGDAVARFVDPNGDVWRVEQRKEQVLAILGGPANDGPLVDDAWKSMKPASP